MKTIDLAAKKQKIRAAFESLTIPPENLPLLRSAFAAVMSFDVRGTGTTPKKFVQGDDKCLDDLSFVERWATDLADFIQNEMHQSAIVAMHDWNMRDEISQKLRITADCASDAIKREETRLLDSDGKPITRPSKGGRPESARALALSTITADHYYQLTGEEPGMRNNAYAPLCKVYGPFYDLLKAVFEALDVKGNPEHYGRLAAIARKK